MRMGGAQAHQRSSPGQGIEGRAIISLLEVGMVSAAESDEVCSVGFFEDGFFFFSGLSRV